MRGAIAYYVRYKQILYEDKQMIRERDHHVRDIAISMGLLGVPDIRVGIL